MKSNKILIIMLAIIMTLVYCEDESSTNSPTEEELPVTIVCGTTEKIVNLNAFELTTFEGKPAVLISTIITASEITNVPQNYNYDFIGQDGFSPHETKGLPLVPYEYLDEFYVVLEEMKLYYTQVFADYCENTLGLEYYTAYKVRDIAKIKLFDIGTTIKVTYGTTEKSVSLDSLSPTTFENKPAICAETIVVASGITDTQNYDYDFIGQDGYSPHESRGLPLITYEYLDEFYLVLEEVKMYYTQVFADYCGNIIAYRVKNVVEIKLFDITK